jgi:Asp-tRNA(Asn)/Glu-tRNA(Gln) amidotransferase A subunit family amidase
MKIMISQPMRGKTNEQIKEERAELVKQLEAEGHEVVNTVQDISEGKSPMYYLSKSIEMMSEVDGVVFMSGYYNARGCRIEHDVAREYGKFIRYV